MGDALMSDEAEKEGLQVSTDGDNPDQVVTPTADDDGNKKKGPRSGLKDLFVSEEMSGGFDLTRALLEAPDDFSLLLARSRLDEQEIGQLVRILGREDRYETGITRLAWLKLAAKIGQGGKAREESIRAASGGQSWSASLRAPLVNVIDKFRTPRNGMNGRDVAS